MNSGLREESGPNPSHRTAWLLLFYPLSFRCLYLSIEFGFFIKQIEYRPLKRLKNNFWAQFHYITINIKRLNTLGRCERYPKIKIMRKKVENKCLQLGVPSSVCLSLVVHHYKEISKLEILPAVHKWSQKWLSLLFVDISASMWYFTSWVCLVAVDYRAWATYSDNSAAWLGTSYLHFHSDLNPVKIFLTGGSEVANEESSRLKKTEFHSLI